MLAAGDTTEVILEGYPWLEREDIIRSNAAEPQPKVRVGVAALIR